MGREPHTAAWQQQRGGERASPDVLGGAFGAGRQVAQVHGGRAAGPCSSPEREAHGQRGGDREGQTEGRMRELVCHALVGWTEAGAADGSCHPQLYSLRVLTLTSLSGAGCEQFKILFRRGSVEGRW